MNRLASVVANPVDQNLRSLCSHLLSIQTLATSLMDARPLISLFLHSCIYILHELVSFVNKLPAALRARRIESV